MSPSRQLWRLDTKGPRSSPFSSISRKRYIESATLPYVLWVSASTAARPARFFLFLPRAAELARPQAADRQHPGRRQGVKGTLKCAPCTHAVANRRVRQSARVRGSARHRGSRGAFEHLSEGERPRERPWYAARGCDDACEALRLVRSRLYERWLAVDRYRSGVDSGAGDLDDLPGLRGRASDRWA